MRALFFLLLIGSIGSGLLSFGQPTPPRKQLLSDPVQGKAIVEEVLSQRPESSELYGVLRIRDGEGRRFEIPMRYSVVTGDETWRGVYETKSSGNIPAERLVIIHHADGPNEYFYSRAEKPGETPPDPESLPNEKIWAPLAGTDFWIGDLGLEFLRWPEQVLVDKEMRKGRSCRVIESINPKLEAGGYARVRSWIDLETGGLVLAEGYDSQNKLLKEFAVRTVKKVNGRYQPKEFEIRNDQTDSRTRLEFNLELEARQSEKP
jgi:hypothetical protein